jgi:membrane-associated protease RseP (regulator of RpoE activity)
MRFSMRQSGKLAVLAIFSSLPLARAQNADGPSQRVSDAGTLSDKAVQFVARFDDGQTQPAKGDEGQEVRDGQGDRGKETDAARLRELVEGSLRQVQGHDAVNRVYEWVQANQGANPQGQKSYFYDFQPNQDHQFNLWFAHPSQASSGMSLVAVDDALRSHLKLLKDQGLLISGIEPNSPAAAAGLHQNDVLLKVGDSPLAKPEDLGVGLKSAGERVVVLSILRDGIAREVRVQPRIHVTFGPVQPQPVAQDFWIGVSVADVEPALRAQLRLSENKGLLVNQVFKDSPAMRAGLKVNDILLSLGGRPLSEQKTLVELVQANGGKAVTLELLREGKQLGDVQVVPERRKLPQAADLTSQLQTLRWDVVRPGVVLDLNNPQQFQLRELKDLTSKERKTKVEESKDTNAALSKRLDDLDAEIKKLRKALEELGSASKAKADLNQAIEELLKKLSADKK